MPVCAEVLVDLGVPRRVAAPPLWRLLWRLGVSVRPPYYTNVPLSFLTYVVVFSLLWGGTMCWMVWGAFTFRHLIGSLFYGVGMALFFQWSMRRVKQKYALLSWEKVLELGAAKRSEVEEALK